MSELTPAGSDLLLEWVSEKGQGTWGEFRDAWQWIASAERGAPADAAGVAWRAAADLSALGHLEVSWAGKGAWAVAPPAITAIPNSGGRALITGARTRALFKRARRAGQNDSGLIPRHVQAMDLWYDPVTRRGAPTALYVAVDHPGQARELASACGIPYIHSASAQLAAMLPALEQQSALWKPGRLPQGHQPEWFDAQLLRWHECEDEPTKPGLYRSKTWTGHTHVLIAPTGTHYRVPREPAVFEVLRWQDRDVLAYSAYDGKLWVPSYARLPLLHERTAVLCTGTLPRRWTHEGVHGHFYPNVPQTIAESIARSLRQELTSLD